MPSQQSESRHERKASSAPIRTIIELWFRLVTGMKSKLLQHSHGPSVLYSPDSDDMPYPDVGGCWILGILVSPWILSEPKRHLEVV